MREQVFNAPDFEVVHVPAAGVGPVFVTFDSLADAPVPGRPGFAEGFLARHGYDAYHFIHGRNAWYQHPEMLAALSALRARIGPDRPIITYGSSMGGYAAYRFSGLLDAAKVVAFSPQYAADFTRTPWETRWRQLRDGVPALWDGLPVSAKAEVTLFYDSKSPDRRHARLIGRAMKARHVRLQHGGHPCMPMMQELGLLGPAVLEIAAGTFDPRAFERRVGAARDTSARYLSNKALALPRLAGRRRLALAEAAIALAPDDPWYRAVHGRLLAAHGAWAQADARFREAMAMLPDHAPLLMSYRHFLMKAGRWADAEATLEKAMALHPEAFSRDRELSVIRAARARAARPRLVRALVGLVRTDGLRRL